MDAKYFQQTPFKKRQSAPDYIAYNYVRFPWFVKALLIFEKAIKAFEFTPFLLKNSMRRAFDATGPLDQRWGSDKELGRVRAVIEAFSDGLDNNPNISIVGRLMYHRTSRSILQSRQKVIAHYESNRKFIEANGRINKPIIITGAYRTGTTLLQRLMGEDPQARSPFMYELESPTPPLQTGNDPLADPRIAQSNSFLNAANLFTPGFLPAMAKSHLMSATEKEESFIASLLHHGLDVTQAANAGKAFITLLNDPSFTPAIFRYERLFYTMLDAYCPAPSHWIFKAPSYAPYFSGIFDEYTDARVVLMHRTPLEALPSACRLFETVCLPGSVDGSFNKHRFGEFIENAWSGCLSAPLEFRRNHPERESQIFDCRYDDLVSDPIAMVKNIYAYFGINCCAEFEKKMLKYLHENGQGKHGRHEYSLEEYGYTENDLYRRNKKYMDNFEFGAQLLDSSLR